MARRSLSFVAISFLIATSAAFSQATSQTSGSAPAGAQGPRRQMPAPTHLKVLPKDTNGPQVIAIMRNFEGDLGVECTYCHAKDPATGHPNFASDANPMKDRARIMMKSTSANNPDSLTQFPDPKPKNPVPCATCHRGMSEPSVFVP